MDNYDLMRSKLPEDARTMWDATRDSITQDLLSNGIKYFCRYAWKSTETYQYNSSSNFIDYDKYGKMYRIHDGFIGYVKFGISRTLVPDGYNFDSWPEDDDDQNLEEKLDELVSWISDLYQREMGDYHAARSTFLLPTMKLDGDFAEPNATFMRNPDKEEDAIFSSDDELEAMRQSFLTSSELNSGS